MSIETLSIETDNVNGTLRRIWTIIEQRGWFVRSLLVEEKTDGGVHTWVQVSPTSDNRDVETLRRQIDKLINVRHTKLLERSRVQPSAFEEIPYAEAS